MKVAVQNCELEGIASHTLYHLSLLTTNKQRTLTAMIFAATFLFASTAAWTNIGIDNKRTHRSNRPKVFGGGYSTALEALQDGAKQEQRNSPVVVTGVTLKIALDANGAAADLAEIKSERFTCPESLDMVHRLRRVSDAVLVGRGTVKQDNPSLTVRRVPCDGPQPVRVIIDPKLSLVLEESNESNPFQVFDDGLPTVVYHCVNDLDRSSLNLSENTTCVFLPPPASHVNTIEFLRSGEYISAVDIVDNLSRRFEIKHLMVEGGPVTARLFLQSKLVDRVILVKAPMCFRKPLDAKLSDELFQQAGLQKLGPILSCGVDTIECWAKQDVGWPTEEVRNWP